MFISSWFNIYSIKKNKKIEKLEVEATEHRAIGCAKKPAENFFKNLWETVTVNELYF